MTTLWTNIKLLRKANSISQQELADKIHTTQQRVSEWECDKVEPSLHTILKLLKIFNVSFEELTENVEEN